MRFVDRNSVRRPDIYQSKMFDRVGQEIAEFLSLPKSKQQSVRPPTFLKLLRDGELSRSLYALFNNKCAFCETPISSDEPFVASPFRPPHSADDGSGNTSVLHYFWLMPVWENLHLVCETCSMAKANKFPVRGKRANVGKPWEEVNRTEKKILLDPCVEFPHEHMSFEISGKCIGLSGPGRSTIEAFDLNREALQQARRVQILQLVDRIFSNPKTRKRLDYEPLKELNSKVFSDTAPFCGAMRIVIWKFLKSASEEFVLLPPKFEEIHDFYMEHFLRRSPGVVYGVAEKFFGEILKTTDQPSTERTDDIASEKNSSVTRTPAKPKASPERTTEVFDHHEPRLLSEIDIKNFKAIKHLHFEIDARRKDEAISASVPCLTLLGENATGKSTVLEAIALTLLGTNQISKLKLDPKDYLQRQTDQKSVLPAEINITFHGSHEPVQLLIAKDGKSFQGSSTRTAIVLAYGPRRYFNKGKSRRLKAPFNRVKSLIGTEEHIPHPGPWLKKLNPRDFAAASRALREILMLEQDDDILRDGLSGDVVVVIEKIRTPLDLMSEGYKSLMALAVDIMRELLTYFDGLEMARGVVLIDEIEIHLHPRWKLKLMTGLRKALPNVQFIVSTHDPLCTRGMDGGEVQVLLRDEERKIDRLVDLPNVQGFMYDQLLMSEFFGLDTAADPVVEDDLARYIARISHKSEDQEEGVISERLAAALLDGNHDQQIEQEALTSYLNEKNQPIRKRKIRRKQAVQQILDVLKSKRRG